MAKKEEKTEEEKEQINLKELDIDALKVLAYDMLIEANRVQGLVNAIQAEINSRSE